VQLKNNNPVPVFQPYKQIPGVFITAAVLAVILLRWVEKYAPGEPANTIYGLILFFGIVLVYTLDHLFDLVKIEQKKAIIQSHHFVNVFICVVSSAAIGALLAFNSSSLDFGHFWILLLPAFVYVFVALNVIPFIRGFKELIIALTVSLSLVYPLVNAHPMLILKLALPAFVVCLMNLLLYGFFEKEKDSYFGFKTIYSSRDSYKAYKHLINAFVILTIALAIGWVFLANLIFPFAAAAALYWIVLVFQKQISNPNIYRWLLDLVLVIIMI